MRTEAEIRAALDDLMWSLSTGYVPSEAADVVKGEVAALRFALGEECDGFNLARLLDGVRSLRVDWDAEAAS